MKQLFFFFIASLTVFSACDNTSNSKKHTPKVDSTFSPIVNKSNRSVDTVRISDKTLSDSTITIIYPELSLKIKQLILFDDSTTTMATQADTVKLLVDLGETIEGQLISLNSDGLTDVKLEQRYKTSVSIADEGPHCDMLEWKHYNSEWKRLHRNKDGDFICLDYSEKDSQKFPSVSIREFRSAVKKHCGQRWDTLIRNVNKVTDAPSNVGISHFFLRLTGKLKTSGKKIVKLIVIETPMGC
ncbi:hypothetical protein LT679_10755 [Mucilaginibacter roseus]|uniref:Lipoprotein n=1 Tax=Mucilaginibacter roseus TaxID=1528868 RepID=A0ABS8U360_9SPHI|nr:hypothetical protein [Mucilaginibacter roseus]MCD8741082.1 hypothetical protein [Mucilaginibacter roseus]